MQQRWIAWLLVAVLGLQAYLIVQVVDLRREQRNDSSRIENNIRSVEHRVNNLDNQLSFMAREAQWVRDIRDRVEPAPGCTGGSVTIDWTFRDLAEGAQVQLLYRELGQTDWKVVDARPTGGLGYAAGFPVAGQVRGMVGWEVARQLDARGSQVASEVRAAQEEPQGRYEYRMVARENGQERGSELHVLDTTRLFYTWFQARVNVQPDNQYFIAVIREQQKPDERDGCRNVVGAAVRGYAGGNKVLEQELGVQLQGDVKADRPLDQMELVVRYASGAEEVHQVPLR